MHTEATDLVALFPPYGLTVTASELTLRLMRDEDFPEYAALLRHPVFAEEDADHVFPWWKVSPEQRVRNALSFQWSNRGDIAPESWSLNFGVWSGQRLIGSQSVDANEFTKRRTVTSGSWLTRDEQGKGYGRLMRQAMLVLAFDHLGAWRAESGAVVGNDRSFAVSRACGYTLNGTRIVIEGERVLTHQEFVVTPDTFVRPQLDVAVTGLTDELRSMLGV